MTIHFSIDTKPIPQARPRVGRFNTYEPERCTNYKSLISWTAKQAMQGKTLFTSPIRIDIKVFRNQSPTSKQYGDWDNHAKSVCDALNGIVYEDDAQIVDGRVQMFKDKNQRVEVMVTDEV